MDGTTKSMKFNDTIPLNVNSAFLNCRVNISQKIERNDFVFVKLRNNDTQIVKIVKLLDGKRAIARWFMRKRELPKDFTYLTKLNKRELIVDASTKPIIIQIASVCGKCFVQYARENDSVDNVLESFGTNGSQSMYVCRYKLVKKTVYELLPIRWIDGAEHSDDDENIDYSDVDQYSQASNCETINLREEIDKLHLSITEREHTDEVTEDGKSVTPFKIIENAVHKVKRNRNEQNPDQNDINEMDVSPSKRSKMVNEMNQNYLLESPAEQKRHQSNAKSKELTKVRKNLNSSFGHESFDDDFNLTPTTDTNAPNYTSEMKSDMVLRIRLPLKEQHDNSAVVDSPRTKYENKHISRLANESTPKRSSIRKHDSGSVRSTPRKSVAFDAKTKLDERTNLEETPSRRVSTRSSSKKALTGIAASIAAQESSPENEPIKHTRSSRHTSKSIEPKTPRSTRKSTAFKTPSSSTMTPQQQRKLYRSGNLTPSIQGRELPIRNDQTELELVRERLHVSAVPTSLPCREKEFSNIHSFVIGKLTDKCGGCIYVSGVPGTGKTATVTQVIKQIQSESKSRKLPAFDYIEINGMRLTEPRQAYVQIYRQLTGKTMAWAQARDLLEDRFTGNNKKSMRTTILLVDELDIICNRKQDVVYNLFDWTTRKNSCLVAITIANTMDLPERVLKLKVASRLGLTRITFQPYSFKQLQEVVMARLAGSSCFISDAVQLVARKVASVSGDCRRALDICRRATEIAEESGSKEQIVNFGHVNQALSEMFASPKVRAIKNCTASEKLFLQAVASEITRTGIEEVDFYGVFMQIGILAPVLGIQNQMSEDLAMKVCMTLAANRLLITEDSSMGLYQKIILNVSVDDLYYALNN